MQLNCVSSWQAIRKKLKTLFPPLSIEKQSSDASTTTIEDLPYEVLHIILVNITPDALVFLSQTSRHFRSLLRLERYHLVQCLLALELNPAYAGHRPRFDAKSSTMVDPSYLETCALEQTRFACCGCLKLLPFHAFESQMIQGLYLRKPSWRARAAKAVSQPGDARARAALRRGEGAAGWRIS